MINNEAKCGHIWPLMDIHGHVWAVSDVMSFNFNSIISL